MGSAFGFFTFSLIVPPFPDGKSRVANALGAAAYWVLHEGAVAVMKRLRFLVA